MLNVNLEDVPFAILDAVEARIMRNRARRNLPPRPRPSLQPGPQQRKFGASSSRWVRSEPGAPQLDSVAVGHAVFGITPSFSSVDSLRVKGRLPNPGPASGIIEGFFFPRQSSVGWTIRSGDWSQAISYSESIPVPSLPTSQWNYTIETIQDKNGVRYNANWSNTALVNADELSDVRYFVLPVSGEACIVVVMMHYYHNYSTKYYSGTIENVTLPFTMTQAIVAYPPDTTTPLSVHSTKANRAYLCSNQSVREVQVPSGLMAILNILNPGGFSPSPNFDLTYGIADYFLGTSDGATTWSPSIYAKLNSVDQFVDPSELRELSLSKRALLQDYRRGYYSYINDGDRNLYYAEWTGDLDRLYDYYFLEGDIRSLSSHGIKVPDNPSSIVPGFVLNAAWDWNDSAYCRNMCFALGFSAADLQP